MSRLVTGHSSIDGNIFHQFVGGQMEVRQEFSADNIGYIRRGEIANVVEGKGEIHIVFNWMAQNTGLPETPSSQWQSMPAHLQVTIDLRAAESFPCGDGCLGINCRTTRETYIFYPKGHVNSSDKPTALDRRDVAGLE
ncbi:MAG: hypothetical protein KBC69_03185 [Candidatus Magasanikbacteria bacterium]|nr:hypothetical protein [Candidatus Magasanikbacteria bacterium]